MTIEAAPGGATDTVAEAAEAARVTVGRAGDTTTAVAPAATGAPTGAPTDAPTGAPTGASGDALTRAAQAAGVVATTNGTERRKERGVALRVLVYVAVAHLLAFYLWLLFAVIGKR